MDCRLSSIVHSQTALKYAYLKAMSYQFCSITTILQVFVNICLRSFSHIYWPNTMSNVNLLKMVDMQQIDLIIKRHIWGWMGHTLRKDESSLVQQAMQWSSLDGIERRNGRPCETCRRTVEKQCKSQ